MFCYENELTYLAHVSDKKIQRLHKFADDERKKVTLCLY